MAEALISGECRQKHACPWCCRYRQKLVVTTTYLSVVTSWLLSEMRIYIDRYLTLNTTMVTWWGGWAVSGRPDLSGRWSSGVCWKVFHVMRDALQV